MWGTRIRIDADLYERLVRCAARAGYSSIGELVRHVLEREAERLEQAEDGDPLDQRLRGLGYLS